MRIALVGSRGIPASYSGFETFYEQLAIRLVARGHDVTVFNRSHFIKDVKGTYKGVRLVSLPCIRTKHLETITHTLLASLWLLPKRYDIAYYCIVGNAPLAGIPRLVGTKTLLNVDGADYAREKWGAFARRYQQICERVATVMPNIIVADALAIKRRYQKLYHSNSVFVPYGANVKRISTTDVIRKWNLESRKYILYVGRFVPENAIDLLIKSFMQVKTDMKLVIIGDAPYADEYRKLLRDMADDNVIFTGYAFGNDYAELSSHAYLAVQPAGIDGTRPALLDQMGFGNCVVVRNTPVNCEVIEDYGVTFDKERPEESLTETLQSLIDFPDHVKELRKKVQTRIKTFYNWEWVTDFYEDLFQRLKTKSKIISYDEFIAKR